MIKQLVFFWTSIYIKYFITLSMIISLLTHRHPLTPNPLVRLHSDSHSASWYRLSWWESEIPTSFGCKKLSSWKCDKCSMVGRPVPICSYEKTGRQCWNDLHGLCQYDVRSSQNQQEDIGELFCSCSLRTFYLISPGKLNCLFSIEIRWKIIDILL